MKYTEKQIKEDFKLFLMITWKHLKLPKPTPVQMMIADYLQHGPARKILMAFRGVGKSWITAAYVDWRLYCNPQVNIMVVSASKTRADEFSTFAQQLINEMPLLAHLRADARRQRTSKVSWDVGPAQADQNASVKSVGIYGQLTGFRADEIIADDVEVPNNSDTQDARDKLAERVKEFEAILKPIAGSRITYLGTPQTELSLYTRMTNRGYDVRVWPALYPSDEYKTPLEHLDPIIAEFIAKNPNRAGTPIDTRFSAEDLEARRLSYGNSGFALQFQLDTSLSDANRYPLKVRDLIVYPCCGEVLPERIVWAADSRYLIANMQIYSLNNDRAYSPAWIAPNFTTPQSSILSVDISGRGADETVGTVIRCLNGIFYVSACKGFLSGYTNDTLEALAKMAKEYKVNNIVLEDNYGNGMFQNLLQPIVARIYPCTIEAVTSHGQKECRIIDTIEPLLNQHRLIFDPNVFLNKNNTDSTGDAMLQYNLIYQMTRLTRARHSLKHDDKIDSLCIGLQYLKNRANIDQNVAAQEAREAYELALEEYFTSGGRNGTRAQAARIIGAPFTPSAADTQYATACADALRNHPGASPAFIRQIIQTSHDMSVKIDPLGNDMGGRLT